MSQGPDCGMRINGHQGPVINLSLERLSGTLASVGTEQRVRLWRLPQGQSLGSCETDEPRATAFALGGRAILHGTGQGIEVWRMDGGGQVALLDGHRTGVQHLAGNDGLESESPLFASCDCDGEVVVWHGQADPVWRFERVGGFTVDWAAVRDLSLSSRGQWLAVVTGDRVTWRNTVGVDRERVASSPAGGRWACAAFRRDGTVATIDDAGRAWLWSVTTGTMEAVVAMPTEYRDAVGEGGVVLGLDDDGSHVIACGGGMVAVWGIRAKEERRWVSPAVEADDASCSAVAVGHGGFVGACGFTNGIVQVAYARPLVWSTLDASA